MGFKTYFHELHKLRQPELGNLVVLQRVASTQALARRVAAECCEEGVPLYRSWIVAYGQSEGKGRQGRSWASPPGAGVYASMILPLEQSGAAAAKVVAPLPLLVASALCDTIDSHLTDVSCRLKWPNDLRVDGAKIGGTLIEVTGQESQGRVALIGFGINHLSWDLPSVEQKTTALAEHQSDPPSLARLTWELLDAVDQRLERMGDTAYAIKRYQGLSEHAPGDRLRVQDGDETIEGVFNGFDEHGFLRLTTAGGERLLSAGEVMAS